MSDFIPVQVSPTIQVAILSGRGSTAYNNPGNKQLRDVVRRLVPQYMNPQRAQLMKTHLVEQVIEHFRERGIQFLKQPKKESEKRRTTTWIPLTHEEKRKKVSHVFRDLVRDEKKKKPLPIGQRSSSTGSDSSSSLDSSCSADDESSVEPLPFCPESANDADAFRPAESKPLPSQLLALVDVATHLARPNQVQSRNVSMNAPLDIGAPVDSEEMGAFLRNFKQNDSTNNVSEHNNILDTLDQELTLCCLDDDDRLGNTIIQIKAMMEPFEGDW